MNTNVMQITPRDLLDCLELVDRSNQISRRHAEATLKLCLWQVGVAGGGIVLLVGGVDTILEGSTALARVAYALAQVCFLMTIALAIRAYHSTVTALMGREATTYAEYARSMNSVIPTGLGGQLSAEQEAILRKGRSRHAQNAR